MNSLPPLPKKHLTVTLISCVKLLNNTFKLHSSFNQLNWSWWKYREPLIPKLSGWNSVMGRGTHLPIHQFSHFLIHQCNHSLRQRSISPITNHPTQPLVQFFADPIQEPSSIKPRIQIRNPRGNHTHDWPFRSLCCVQLTEPADEITLRTLPFILSDWCDVVGGECGNSRDYVVAEGLRITTLEKWKKLMLHHSDCLVACSSQYLQRFATVISDGFTDD